MGATQRCPIETMWLVYPQKKGGQKNLTAEPSNFTHACYEKTNIRDFASPVFVHL